MGGSVMVSSEPLTDALDVSSSLGLAGFLTCPTLNELSATCEWMIMGFRITIPMAAFV